MLWIHSQGLFLTQVLHEPEDVGLIPYLVIIPTRHMLRRTLVVPGTFPK